MANAKHVLVLNCGSTTIKFQVIDMAKESRIARGTIDRVGRPDATVRLNQLEQGMMMRRELPVQVRDHAEGMSWILANLPADVRIDAVGHRVVHGGAHFSAPTLVNDDVIARIESCSSLAPLHNPVNLMGIREGRRLLPNVPHVASFDTAFHIEKPLMSQLFALPHEFYEKKGVRKFGFHGASHRYVSQRAARLLDRPYDELRMISCHLGGGCTITAIAGGKAVDTTATFGTSGGLPMGTRAGDVDLGLVFHLMEQEKLSVREVEDLLYRKSGLLGMSGISSDMVEVTRHANEGHERARIARDFFIHSVVKTIGSFVAVLQGVDAIIFTAGIGENDAPLRAAVLDRLGWLGVRVDPAQNALRGQDARISTTDSQVHALVVPTDEELMIAREVLEVVNPNPASPFRL